MSGETPPTAHELAWLALLPTSAPALSAEERGRVQRIRDGAALWMTGPALPDAARVVARCDLLLAP
jgi:hypothetical protein